MKKQRTTLLAAGVVAAMVGLAGCGGSSNKDMEDGQKTPAEMAAEMAAERATMQRTALTTASAAVTEVTDDLGGTPTQAVIDDARTKVAALETAINNAKDVPASELTAYRAQHGTADNSVKAAQMARTDANDAALEKQRMEEEEEQKRLAAAAEEEQKRLAAAAKKMGEDLYDALRGDGEANATALDNIMATSLMAEGLRISVEANAGTGTTNNAPAVPARTNTDLKPKSESAVDPLDGWNGMDFAGTSGTGAEKITDEARVYHNQGAPESKLLIRDGGPFYLVAGATGQGAVNNGYLARGGTSNGDLLDVSALSGDLGRVMAPAFLHQGTQTHPVPEKENGVYVRGTFDGAPGEFRCPSGCSSTNDGEGSPSALGGTWYFKPDANAMVSTPDDTYLYFGWWVSKNSDNEPTAASAFAGTVGGVMGAGTSIVHGWADESAADAITGSATYIGAAVGKYAYKDISGGTAHGGHFTADAELTAKFGDHSTSNNGGVEGTIDDFRLNDGSEDPGWSVKLNKPASNAETWSGNGGIVGGTTVWSINSNAAPAESIAKGTWSGTMYDERPGDAPDGDGSNIPTVVTGTFYSEFGSEGRMVGAFGANHSGN